jgi:dTDP-4-dehydrorhamnose 3,5-epimerase/CDP-3, 6-dideoxy-D-glycero-D-glycero-4-hexulose-5-epimerase
VNPIEELLPNTWLIRPDKFEDLRGTFVKSLTKTMLDSLDCQFSLHEEYYSVSKKDVIRGMHFQIPPHDHIKIIYCLAGSVLDVVLDLRQGLYYGAYCSRVLDASSPSLLIIPKGVAHGFRALKADSLVVYKTSSEYDQRHDAGIMWDSFGFDWGLNSPILSSRDSAHTKFKNFKTPF